MTNMFINLSGKKQTVITEPVKNLSITKDKIILTMKDGTTREYSKDTHALYIDRCEGITI